MCTLVVFIFPPCAPFVDLDISLNAHKHLGLRGWLFGLPLYFQAYVSFIYPTCVIECNKWAFVPVKLYNFQQRISWLSHRWRTQRNAISNVNCRIQWIIESLNAPCAPWYSEEHACLSVINISTSSTCVECWMWGFFLCWLHGQLPWNALAEQPVHCSLAW